MKYKDFIYERLDLNRACEKRILLASKLYHKGGVFKVLAFILHRMNRRKFNIEIYPNVEIGQNFRISHCVGIVIGKTASIGSNCMVFPNVVIGAKYSNRLDEMSEKRRHAIIGDNCILGTGSKIVGPVVIGNNVIIGANAIITKDIPNDSTVIGINRIIKR